MNLLQEKRLWKKGCRFIAGVDEVGRGALAGPVMAAAVMLLRQPKSKIKNSPFGRSPEGRQKLKFRNSDLLKIKDSKQLTPIQRNKYYKLLTNNSGIVWSVAAVSPKTIDKIGIDKAVWRAMENAVLRLRLHPVRSPMRTRIGRRRGRLTSNGARPDFLLIDGNRFASHKLKPITHKLIIKGDEKIFSIAAASVIAKVTRDRLMARLAKKYSQYGFEKHKGYGTAEHFKALKKYGLSEIHRKSFL